MLRVFYGYSKLTQKSVRKAELAIYFENANNNISKNDEWIERRIKVVHIRRQSKGEETDSKHSNRMFTKYSYYIDDKPFNGDIDRVLFQNYQADKIHVSKTEREEIRKKLRREFFPFYNRKDNKKQLSLNFK